MASELTRRDRMAACDRLSELADELDQIGSWLDRLSDDHLADRAARVVACGARDLSAAAWLLHRGGEPLPDRWLAPVPRVFPGRE